MSDFLSAVIGAFCLTAHSFGIGALVVVAFIALAFVMSCVVEGIRWAAEELSPLQFLGASFLFVMLTMLVLVCVDKYL